MPIAALSAALCLRVACAVRPTRDWTDISRDLEITTEDPEIRTDCIELKKSLEQLGLRGEAHPCEWDGVDCEHSCRVRSISSRSAHGDLLALQGMTALRKLRLSNTGVRGDIEKLQDLTGLEELSLDNTYVSGDVENLHNLRGLRLLSLRNTGVHGDIEKLQHLTRIKELSLYNTGVHGDIENLQNFTDLEALYVSDTGLRGDIENLQNLRVLERLSLRNTEVQGDVKYLQNLTGLQRLSLYNTGVSGDIENLQKLTGLIKLFLSNTGVRGDIENLQYLTGLKRLSLGDTGVGGDVENLQDLRGLRRLSLYNTGVRGQIKNLQKLTALEAVSLVNTNVQGDIENLRTLTGLKELSLDNTSTQGDIDALLNHPSLEVAKLRGTGVSGWISSTWNGRCKRLRELHLGESQVGPAHPLAGTLVFWNSKPLLPALHILNVSGCRLNATVKDLLVPLANSPLATIVAASSGITGEMPDLSDLDALVENTWQSQWMSKLSRTLQALDLSSNSVTALTVVPASLRVDLSTNKIPLRVSASALATATSRQVEVWLEGTQVANPGELGQLLPRELRLQDNYTRIVGGFACRELVKPWLRITPELFMPESMCACRAGYQGHATRCSPCPVDTYTNEMNSARCSFCPPSSKSGEASESWGACECNFGAISAAGDALRCQCPAEQALVAQPGNEHCVPCAKLHLSCPEAGSNATTAEVFKGYARLQGNSSEVFKCLDTKRCTASGCEAGYHGTLCSDCLPGYRAAQKGCQQCTDLETISSKRMACLGFCGACVLVLLAAAAWSIRRYVTFDLRYSCALNLVLPQLAVLLQLVQLWAVLGRLAQPLEDDFDLASNATNATPEDVAGGEFFSLEAFQLTSNELQNLVALQCIFEGAVVRVFFATATPLMPLVLLLACCFLEIFSKGMGIQVALKIMTVLFIGGAAGAAQLLSCQRVDGSGKRPLADFAFRPLIPHLQCTDAKWVDWIGHACATCYGVVIPCFLALLFAKQHLTMRQCKTFIAQSDDKEEVTLQLQLLSTVESLKEDAKRKRLVAAAAAYVAVHFRGRVLVVLKEDAVTVKMIHASDAGDFQADFSDHLVYEEPSLLRSRRKIIQHNAMVQMLMERTVLADIQTARSDRIMLGASQILCKYVNCSFVWMEVCMKLASAALVSVVASKDGFWLSGAILLGMALVVGIAQPFERPQVNALQTSCFACLALAALGFKENWRQLSYLALALPVLQLLLSLLRPDSSQALALRLHKELEEKLLDGPAEVSAEEAKFL